MLKQATNRISAPTDAPTGTVAPDSELGAPASKPPPILQRATRPDPALALPPAVTRAPVVQVAVLPDPASPAPGPIAPAPMSPEPAPTGSDGPPSDLPRRAEALSQELVDAAEATEAGTPLDLADMDRLLARADACLGELKKNRLEPEAKAARAALVDAAIYLTNAIQKTIPAGTMVSAPLAALRAQTGAVTFDTAQPEQRAPARRNVTLWIAFAACLLGVAAYHLNDAWADAARRRAILGAGPLPGAVAANPGGGQEKILLALSKGGPSPADLERFRKEEAAKGNVVVEVAPGMLAVRPNDAPQGHAATAGGAP